MNKAVIYKKLGETPLEALERFRAEFGQSGVTKVPMTYAGRLDPMAEGLLLILIGDECKKKDEYLGLDKEYEVEIVFGISTDTHDMLGLAEIDPKAKSADISQPISKTDLQRHVGKFNQTYPAYSSKTIGGKQLHSLARAGELPDESEMPQKEVEIYSIDLLVESEISTEVLHERILQSIDLVKGDFRQDEIKQRWAEIFFEKTQQQFKTIKIKVKCSSGTYMRSLADRIGKDGGSGALAISIKRTKLGSYTNTDRFL
jgi:tRNA pseudouridine55 synthase